MILQGEFKKTFADATHGLVTGVNLDAQWKYFAFRVGPRVLATVVMRGYADDMPLTIHVDRRGNEYVEIVNTCPLQVAMKMKPETHRVYPFWDRPTAEEEGRA